MRPTAFRPEIEVEGKSTRVLVEQTAAVDPERLGRLVGRLTRREMDDVDVALHMVFGLRGNRVTRHLYPG